MVAERCVSKSGAVSADPHHTCRYGSSPAAHRLVVPALSLDRIPHRRAFQKRKRSGGRRYRTSLPSAAPESFLKSPTNSFFLVSTEIAASLVAGACFT